MVQGETDEETNDLKTRQCMARYVEAYVSYIETQSKSKMDHRENQSSIMLDNYVVSSSLNLMMRNSNVP